MYRMNSFYIESKMNECMYVYSHLFFPPFLSHSLNFHFALVYFFFYEKPQAEAQHTQKTFRPRI